MLGLFLLPCLAQGIPHPPTVSAINTKSCGCISEEERGALSSPIPADLSISEEESQRLNPAPIELSMVECRSRCFHSPFFAFSSSQLNHHIDSEQDSHHISSVGSCICGADSSSPRPCSDVVTIPVFCTSPPGQELPADSSEGQRPDYSMMALVLLSIAITAIGLTGARAVWQARRRRLRLAKENESQKRSSLAATLAIAQKVIAPGDARGTSLGKGSLPVEVGRTMQDQIVVRHDHPINVNEGVDERKP